jgi:hypothetical protein
MCTLVLYATVIRSDQLAIGSGSLGAHEAGAGKGRVALDLLAEVGLRWRRISHSRDTCCGCQHHDPRGPLRCCSPGHRGRTGGDMRRRRHESGAPRVRRTVAGIARTIRLGGFEHVGSDSRRRSRC